MSLYGFVGNESNNLIDRLGLQYLQDDISDGKIRVEPMKNDTGGVKSLRHHS
jgi:hypothetical protein